MMMNTMHKFLIILPNIFHIIKHMDRVGGWGGAGGGGWELGKVGGGVGGGGGGG